MSPTAVNDVADVVVIGGGIAGVSAAYHLAPAHRVVLLEQEHQLAHHTTGRSAAVYILNYGGPLAMRLTKASRPFFDASPHADHPLLEDRGVLMVGDDTHRAHIEQLAAEGNALDPSIELITGEAARRMVPALRESAVAVGMYEPGGASMDVMGMHQAMVRGAIAAGATIHRSAGVRSIERRRDHWLVTADSVAVEATYVVDAAGAWGDEVAELAGVEPVGLTPMRRTAFTTPVAVDPDWPLVHIDTVDGPCYFRPEAGGHLLCSPADETPSTPCDARPEELDIAMAIDRINAATTLGVRSVSTSWAGQRTFAPDRQPVIGFDDSVPGFCWMVGQGGTGITTAPAAGAAVAAGIGERPLPDELQAVGLDLADLGPKRLRTLPNDGGRVDTGGDDSRPQTSDRPTTTDP